MFPFRSFSEEDTSSASQRQSLKRPAAHLIWIGLPAFIILLAWLFNGYRGGVYELPLRVWLDALVNWLITNFAVVFSSIKNITAVALNNFEKFLLWLPWWAVLMLIMSFAWRLAGPRVAIFSVAGMYLILILGLWDLSMGTLALIATAVLISNALGIPLGILAARNDRLESILRPTLDAMQTMPAFVYLIPALMFFGIGRVPGVIACVIYGLPPAVRLTNLGIRQVPPELVEAALAFGSTRTQLLFKVQLPLALPSVMAGVNQTIMLSLGMVVLAAMIAAGGLGREVLLSLGQMEIGRGFVAGISIVVLAMVLDRITQALGKKRKDVRSVQPRERAGKKEH